MMVLKSRLAVFMFMVITPLAIALISLESFFVLTSILVIFTSGKSLRQLFILNFCSDEAFWELEQQVYRVQTTDENTRKVNRMVVFLLNILLVIFFVYICFATYNIFLRFASGLVAANWIYDMLRTFTRSNNVDDSEGWTLKDTLAEIFLWSHNILAIAVVTVAFAVKFL